MKKRGLGGFGGCQSLLPGIVCKGLATRLRLLFDEVPRLVHPWLQESSFRKHSAASQRRSPSQG